MDDLPYANDACENDSKGRDNCERCKRPVRCCLCGSLPKSAIQLRDGLRITILQHPNERKRVLSTTRILQLCIPDVKIVTCHRIRFAEHPQLNLSHPNTLLIYPSPQATDLPSEIEGHHLVFLDATWSEVKKMYLSSPDLKDIKHVKLTSETVSKFVIRSQPKDKFLSTIESVAICLKQIPSYNDISKILLKPLDLMCRYQIDLGGCTVHESVESRVRNNTYEKPLSQKRRRYLLDS
ncbi:hypothetical protein GJ496_010097 [Pomphorhynchus laevis]|nr:hypothetical protein GJ496_010097 [Pomphorhynchus laevis]